MVVAFIETAANLPKGVKIVQGGIKLLQATATVANVSSVIRNGDQVLRVATSQYRNTFVADTEATAQALLPADAAVAQMLKEQEALSTGQVRTRLEEAGVPASAVTVSDVTDNQTNKPAVLVQAATATDQTVSTAAAQVTAEGTQWIEGQSDNDAGAETINAHIPLISSAVDRYDLEEIGAEILAKDIRSSLIKNGVQITEDAAMALAL